MILLQQDVCIIVLVANDRTLLLEILTLEAYVHVTLKVRYLRADRNIR